MIKAIKSKVQISGSVPNYTAESGAVVAGIYKKLKEEDPKAVEPYLIALYRLLLGLMDRESKEEKAAHDARMMEVMKRRREEREKRKEALANGGSIAENFRSTDGEDESNTDSTNNEAEQPGSIEE